jgi:predicted DNA-binding transcriptional regulator YafY
MSRAERLIELLQLLRSHRHAVTGDALARKLGVSLRTLYRDIASLQAQGAVIEGSPGVGYLLRPGFLLPPLMFTDEQLEALVLGARWVAAGPDAALALAARELLVKVAAAVPADKAAVMQDTALLVAPRAAQATVEGGTVAAIRAAIGLQHKLKIDYRSGAGEPSTRTVWPFALGFFDAAEVLAAWCELRGGFRHFRLDRLARVTPLDERYPTRRQALFRRWLATQPMAPDSLALTEPPPRG